MYRFKGAKVISDTTTCEIGNTHYREMIVKRGSEYACLCYIKGSPDSPDVLVAYVKPEKYKKHV